MTKKRERIGLMDDKKRKLTLYALFDATPFGNRVLSEKGFTPTDVYKFLSNANGQLLYQYDRLPEDTLIEDVRSYIKDKKGEVEWHPNF